LVGFGEKKEKLGIRTLALGLNNSAWNVVKGDFLSSDTVKGFDLILLDSLNLFSDSNFGSISKSELQRIAGWTDRRTNEILDQVKQGTVLAIFPAPWFRAWQTKYHAYDYETEALRESWDRLHLGVGLKLQTGHNFEPMIDEFKSYLDALSAVMYKPTHLVSLTLGKGMSPGLRIPNNTDVTAGATRLGNGLVMFLPNAIGDAVTFPGYVEAIWKLGQSLLKTLPEPTRAEKLPEWANDYILPDEAHIRDQIAATIEEINSRQTQLDELNQHLTKRGEAKRLFTADGDELEEAVENTMLFLGFTVDARTKAEENGTDRVFRSGDHAIITEIKGRENRGAVANDLSQLMRWKADFLGKEQKNPDAALVVINAYRKLPLNQRGDKVVFADNIVKTAQDNKFGLITGLQLLGLRVAVEKDELSKEQAQQMLLECVGSFNGFDQIEMAVPLEVADGADS